MAALSDLAHSGTTQITLWLEMPKNLRFLLFVTPGKTQYEPRRGH